MGNFRKVNSASHFFTMRYFTGLVVMFSICSICRGDGPMPAESTLNISVNGAVGESRGQLQPARQWALLMQNPEIVRYLCTDIDKTEKLLGGGRHPKLRWLLSGRQGAGHVLHVSGIGPGVLHATIGAMGVDGDINTQQGTAHPDIRKFCKDATQQ